jgi:hypothetical protein
VEATRESVDPVKSVAAVAGVKVLQDPKVQEVVVDEA